MPTTQSTRKTYHQSYERLIGASVFNGAISPGGLASALNESPQTITNWSKRGVSREGALKAQEMFGVSAPWILTGQGPMLFSAGQLQAADAQAIARHTPPSIAEALKVLADAAARAKPSERASAAGLLRELVIDPASNASELIPIIARRLS